MLSAIFSGHSRPRQESLKLPKPLKARKRALTPLPNSTHGPAAHQQAESALFSKVPPEVRTRIWKECLGGRVLHLTLKGGKLRQLRTLAQPTAAPHYGLLSLSLTCRRAYSETIGILYSDNAVSVGMPECILYMSRLLLLERINAIHELHFTWLLRSPPLLGSSAHREWVTLWQTLGSMPGLRRLRVKLEVAKRWNYDWGQQEGHMLELTKAVTQVKDFLVFLSWPAGSQALPQIPCRVSRDRKTLT